MIALICGSFDARYRLFASRLTRYRTVLCVIDWSAVYRGEDECTNNETKDKGLRPHRALFTRMATNTSPPFPFRLLIAHQSKPLSLPFHK